MALDGGHEIGCHGLTHGLEEQYHLLPYDRQKEILKEAKERIEQVISRDVISFRSPAFKISGNTIRALEDTGFKIESSVNPQRLGIFSSDVANVGWMYSPRRPYHPDFSNPFRRGKSSVWEIPVSSFIFPFMSNTGMAFGAGFLKMFFRLLYKEAGIKKNPIVYMFHPEDIYPNRETGSYKFRWHHLLPSRVRGFEIRNILFHSRTTKQIQEGIIELLHTMKKANNAQFISFSKTLPLLESGKGYS